MLFNQLIGEAEVDEKEITDLLVSQITLQTMLDVLKISHGSDIARHVSRSEVDIPNELALDHGLHRATLEPSHGIERGLQLRCVDLKGRARLAQNCPWASSIWEDALGDAAVEIMRVEIERGRVSSVCWKFHQVELVVSTAHLLLPVAVLMITLVPQEILVEQLWQYTLRL